MKEMFKKFAPPPAKDGKPAPSFFGNDTPESHDAKTLGAYVYDPCSMEENLKRWQISPKTIREGPWGKEYFLIGPDQTSYFSFCQVDVKGSTELRKTGYPQVGIVLKGKGAIVYDGGKFEVKQGDEVFLPYDIPGAKLEGDFAFILCHPEGANAEYK
jgi:mannose-6-phosphate isomerase class I